MKLFIGCSSSNNLSDVYYEECALFLDEVLKDNDLVYGAYNNGIMSIAYNIACKYNRNIIAITTDRYEEELDNINCTYKKSEINIFRRCESLIVAADIIIILPGGIGTINELISAIETMRNKEYNKPILIYNINGFFNKFFDFMEQIYEEKFSDINDKKYYQLLNTKEEIIEYLNNYKECYNGRENWKNWAKK